MATPASSDGINCPPPRTCAPMFITVKLLGLFAPPTGVTMTDTFTDASRAIFAKKVLAHVASLDPDGSPNVTPVWVELDGDDIVINTALGRAKARNLANDERVAISLTDPDDPRPSSRCAAPSSCSPPTGPTRSSTDWPRSTSGPTAIVRARDGEIRVDGQDPPRPHLAPADRARHSKRVRVTGATSSTVAVAQRSAVRAHFEPVVGPHRDRVRRAQGGCRRRAGARRRSQGRPGTRRGGPPRPPRVDRARASLATTTVARSTRRLRVADVARGDRRGVRRVDRQPHADRAAPVAREGGDRHHGVPVPTAQRHVVVDPSATRPRTSGILEVRVDSNERHGLGLQVLFGQALDVDVAERQDAHRGHEARRAVHVPHPGVVQRDLEQRRRRVGA